MQLSWEQALQERLTGGKVQFAQGSNVHTITGEQIAEALEVASKADLIVLALGEDSEMSGEGGSRTDIRLPAAQLELVKQAQSSGKTDCQRYFQRPSIGSAWCNR